MRKSQASESSKPTPKAKPRFATITGFEQRAGAAMFHASLETVSGDKVPGRMIAPSFTAFVEMYLANQNSVL